MNIQELVDRTKQRDPALEITIYDRTTYVPGKNQSRETRVEVTSTKYGEGSAENVYLRMGNGTMRDHVVGIEPGNTTRHWQVAAFLRVLDDNAGRVRLGE